MRRRGTEPYQYPALEPIGGKLVADALFSFWSCGADGLPQLLERASLVTSEASEVLVNCLSFDLGWGLHRFHLSYRAPPP